MNDPGFDLGTPVDPGNAEAGREPLTVLPVDAGTEAIAEVPVTASYPEVLPFTGGYEVPALFVGLALIVVGTFMRKLGVRWNAH